MRLAAGCGFRRRGGGEGGVRCVRGRFGLRRRAALSLRRDDAAIHAEHPAERARDAPEARIGGQQRRHFGFAQQGFALRPTGGGAGDQAEQPARAAGQHRGRRGDGVRCCGEGTEAGGNVARALPDGEEQRRGETPEVALLGDAVRQPGDDGGEAVGGDGG